MSTMQIPHFKERKAIQVAALLIKHNGGQSIDKYKLLKLIYLVDRKALELWGHSVTYDTPANLPYDPTGPTPIHTYDLIDPPKTNLKETSSTSSYWSQFFSNYGGIVSLLGLCPGVGDLSPAEIGLIHEIFEEFGHKTFGELKEYLQALPESKDTEGSSGPIKWETLLQAVGWTGEDLEEVKKDLTFKAKFETFVGAR